MIRPGPARMMALAALAPLLFGASTPAPASAADPAGRYTDETPDAMIDVAAARATSRGAPEASVLAALAEIVALSDRASHARATTAVNAIAAAPMAAETRMQAVLTGRSLAEDEGSASGIAADRAAGVVTELLLLGPLRDTGGGLAKREGPEAVTATFGDRLADYSWGTVEARWRAVPSAYASAKGVPLDVFVSPRRESCSLVATQVTLEAPTTLIVRLAATGQARLMMDGEELGSSDDSHAGARFDRLAAKVEAGAGSHGIWAKICTGALDDDGRARLGITTADGKPVKASAELNQQKTAGTKLRFERMSTPLTRALKPGPGPDALLDAVILRTLGGADDGKSPRAPGLLDTLTAMPADLLSADRLAMAAWVAPSGANRSGWLYLANRRATEHDDPRTRAFTERRMIALHVVALMPDWAMTAAHEQLAHKTDAEAALLLATTEEALGTDALRLSAMRRLAVVADRDLVAAPTALLESLARISASFEVTRATAALKQLATRGTSSAALVGTLAKKSAAEASDAALTAFAGRLESADAGLAIARLIARTGRHDDALALYERLIEWSPNRAPAWAGRADELKAATAPPTALKLVMLSLQRARELEPTEARTRAQLELYTAAIGGPPRVEDDEKYMVSSQTLLARRQGVSSHPTVTSRELHWVRAVVMHPDRRVSQLIHYAREIVIAPRRQDELVEELPVEGERTELLRARIHRKDGGIAFPLEEHNDGTRPHVRWPELEPGDVVEIAVRSWTARAVGGRGDPPYYFIDYAGATSVHPLLYNEVDIEGPVDHPIYVDVLNAAPGSFERTEKVSGGTRVTSLVWRQPVTVAEEPLSPAMSEIVPVIVGSTFKTWDDFRGWYREAVKGFTEPDEQIKRLASQLTRGKSTREEKLSALFNFVADDIRYVNYTSGESWLPNRPQQLLARREGDCDDKAILLITLLRAVGIDAQEVMVQTRETGQPSIIMAKNAAIPMFDHGIAFLPGPGGGTYLDATSPQSRLGPLPSMDGRAVALRLDSGPAEIVTLPASAPKDHGADVSWSIVLESDGSGALTGAERHSGDGAFMLRNYLSQPDARVQYVEDNLVGGWFPTVEVAKDVTFNGELAHGAATVSYKARSDGLARREHGELVVALSASATLTSSLAPLLTRSLPVSLPSHLAPSHQSRLIRITAPVGFSWADPPAGGDESAVDFGSAHLEVGRDPSDPRVMVVKRTVTFDQHLIPPDKYGAWRAFLSKIDRLMHKSVRAVPTPTPGAATQKAGSK